MDMMEKGIKICTNEGEHPSPCGDKSEKNFLLIFFKTSKLISIKLMIQIIFG
jgi:hypothetical protein